jgi:nickel-dependent lactate racemase
VEVAQAKVHESDRRGGKTEQRTAEPGQIGHTSSWARSVVQWRETASTPPGDVEFLARRPRGLHSAHMTTILPPANPASHGIDPGDPTRVRMIGGLSERLAAEEVQRFVEQAFGAADLDGKRVCLVVPDGTRTCPLPLLLGAAQQALAGRANHVSVVIALGTHQGMSSEHLARHLGYQPGRSEEIYPSWTIMNHESWLPNTFTTLGTIEAARLAELTGGLMTDAKVQVRINRHVAEADVAIVVGPVFPHEVVGFSGGNKYFFPGVSGPELIDLSHWVGALITSAAMIGTGGVTPVRALINEAATMIPAERLAPCLVVASGTDTLHAAAFGTPEDAWAACAEISAETHISYLEAPVKRVLSIMPTKYEDIWTAAKGFYKLEPIVADGGEVIIYAPHITQVSVMHRRSPKSATTTATTSLASGRSSSINRGGISLTPLISAAKAPGTPQPASATVSPSLSPPASPKKSCAPSTSTTLIQHRSTLGRSKPTLTRW